MNNKVLYGCLIALSAACSNSAFAQDNKQQSLTDHADHKLSGTHFPIAVNKQTEEQALLQDLTLVAEAKGWTIAEAKANYEAAEALGEIAAKVAADHPDQFVGSVLSPEPGGTPTLYIKGTAKRAVQDLVRSGKVL